MYTILKQFFSQLLIDDSSHEKISRGIILKYLRWKYSKKDSSGNRVLVLMIAGWISPAQNEEKFNDLNFSFANGELQFSPKASVAITKISESVLGIIPFVENLFRKGI